MTPDAQAGRPRLTFNIIYLPQAVRHLVLFVFSLLRWSDYRFRLVSNACSPGEVQLLQELSDSEPRLEFLALPTNEVMVHHRALSYLQSRESSGHFCCLDSDILAVGAFAAQLDAHLDSCAGVFSGRPVWCTEDEAVMPAKAQRMVGRFSRTEDGLCLGSTYLAIYDNRKLESFMQRAGIGFEGYWWKDIREIHRRRLSWLGVRRKKYDTGKVLNLLLQSEGESMIFVDCPALLHMGGYDSRFRQERLGFREEGLVGYSARRAREMLARRPAKRIVACRYFSELLHNLFQGQSPPPVPDLGDPKITDKMKFFSDRIIEIYDRHGRSLTW